MIATNNRYFMLRKALLILILCIGILFFGIIVPGSFDDHYRLLHFSAHLGTSFLISIFVFNYCRQKLRLGRNLTLLMVFIVTLIIGTVYKWFEIINKPGLRKLSFDKMLEVSGFYISFSQNISGILAALAFLIYFDKKYFKKIEGRNR